MAETQKQVAGYVITIREVDALLDPATNRCTKLGEAGASFRDLVKVNVLLTQHQNGSRDHAKRIWALVCLELWARAHVDRLDTRERACA